MTFEIQEDGLPVYSESFQNGLYEFYHGVKGYIYTCESDFEVDEHTHIKCEVISKGTVPIKDIDPVEDAYERILQYEQQGLLQINPFEELSDEQIRRDKNMVMGAIQRLELLKGEYPLSSFVQEKFPAYWEEALRA